MSAEQAFAATRDEAVAAVLATMGPDHVAECVTEQEISAAMGLVYEISAGARDLRYGRSGGHWAPPMRAGEAPFGALAGKRKTCPEPVRARCSRSCPPWWVVPSAIGKDCERCLMPLRRAA